MLALFKGHAFSNFHCVDEKRRSGGRDPDKDSLIQKWMNDMIKLFDQMIVS